MILCWEVRGMALQLHETSEELPCWQRSSSPSKHVASCSETSWMGHPSSCSTTRPAPQHLQKSAVPKGFRSSDAEFQSHVKEVFFKWSSTGSRSKGTKRLSACLLPSATMTSHPGLPTAKMGSFSGVGFPPQPSLQSLALGPSPGIPPTRLDQPAEVGQPQREQPPTLKGLLHAQSGTANALRANRSNLPLVLAAGKRLLVWEDVVSGQHFARLSSGFAPAQHLSWPWVPPLCPGGSPPPAHRHPSPPTVC